MLKKEVTFHTEPQAVDSEATLSGHEDLEQLDSDQDSTLPYASESREDVYRVGWDGDVVPETSSDEGDFEIANNGELWTHVYHRGDEPAPYSEIDPEPPSLQPQIEEIVIDSEDEEPVSVSNPSPPLFRYFLVL